jgi:heat shock protein HslJ
MNGKLVFAAALVLALALAGCIGPGGLKRADPLGGTSWELTQLDGVATLAGVEVTLQFDDGQAGGSAGCNSYGGAYEIKGHDLAFGPLHSTLRACLDEMAMAQEQRYLQALGQTSAWEFGGERLYLHGADGQPLVFSPVE